MDIIRPWKIETTDYMKFLKGKLSLWLYLGTMLGYKILYVYKKMYIYIQTFFKKEKMARFMFLI